MGGSIAQQVTVFLQAMILGVVFGVLYDMFRVLRIAIKTAPMIVFIQDLLFWLVCLVATFSFVIAFNQGELRFFIFLAEIAGFSLYYITLGRLVYRLSQSIIRLIRTICKTIYRILIRPIVRLFTAIGKTSFYLVLRLKVKLKKTNPSES